MMCKRVLVVGTGYIGKNFADYAGGKEDIAADIVDSRSGWQQIPFDNYDCVLYAAGIAHRKQTAQNKDLYYDINRDLAVDVAQKAKFAGVGQFIYLSSMSVYGKKVGEITQHIKPDPRHNDYYAHSKFEAEAKLKNLAQEGFAVAIIRPPMVYGGDCPGKFGWLVRLAKYLPIVPDTKNKRSMIYIGNLSDFLCRIVLNGTGGVFCPQNREHVNTAVLVKLIRAGWGKKTITVSLPEPLVANICPAFASLFYSPVKAGYQIFELEDSVKKSLHSLCTMRVCGEK